MADPAAAGESDVASLPAFRDVADEIEDRVALLLADLRMPQAERIHHG
jgi:hypothetical protein